MLRPAARPRLAVLAASVVATGGLALCAGPASADACPASGSDIIQTAAASWSGCTIDAGGKSIFLSAPVDISNSTVQNAVTFQYGGGTLNGVTISGNGDVGSVTQLAAATFLNATFGTVPNGVTLLNAGNTVSHVAFHGSYLGGFHLASGSTATIDLSGSSFGGDFELVSAGDMTLDLHGVSLPPSGGTHTITGTVSSADVAGADLSGLDLSTVVSFCGVTGVPTKLPSGWRIDASACLTDTPPPASPPATATTVGRWAGTDRYATAATISAQAFAPGVPVAYVVAGTAFPDGLAAGAVAAHAGGPVLLTAQGSLPAATATELDRLHPGRIVVLGGPAVVSDAVLTALKTHTTGTVTRLYGPDRYTTATQVALDAFTGLTNTVVIANGENYPDALAAVPLAAANGAPLLLIPHDSIPTAVTQALAQLQPTQILIIGGPASITDTAATQLARHATITRIAGADRYATADAVATHLPGAGGALIASGATYPDALAGGAAAAHLRQPLLLAPTTCLEQATLDQLRGTTDIHLLGGTAALTAAVEKLTACG